MSKKRNKKRPPKRTLALPDLEQSKAAVLNTLTSKSGQRSYDRAITDFVDWYCSEPRLAFNRTVTTHVVGDIAGKIPIVIDDIIAGGSVLDQLEALIEAGAKPEIHLVITHGILTKAALHRLDRPSIKELMITDTVPLTPERSHPKIRVCSIAPMLAEVIDRIHRGSSLSDG